MAAAAAAVEIILPQAQAVLVAVGPVSLPEEAVLLRQELLI